ncbi:PREDICTED: actin, cytoskeletal 4-like [Nicotiana attenuata]|uniref:actin, cytoskeletal 4-like n=1 Tax=Nicotiana attenuata TaxID=49451 RepID=UPI000904E77C|nr:PREDICTED: actin, cytoskeletal 4-like [Nicotiana attenuata]
MHFQIDLVLLCEILQECLHEIVVVSLVGFDHFADLADFAGLVVDCGDGGCCAIPFIEGYPFLSAVSQSYVTPRDLSRNLGAMINYEVLVHGKQISGPLCLADDIRNKCCYIALDFEEEMEIAKNNSAMIEESYELPSGKILTIASQRFRFPEVLFNSSVSFLRLDSLSIHEMTYNSIMKSDVNIRRSLFKNIVLAGGLTMIRGFVDRFTKEMTSLAPNNMKIEVVAPLERKYSAWNGGSILASLDSFEQVYSLLPITNNSYYLVVVTACCYCFLFLFP